MKTKLFATASLFFVAVLVFATASAVRAAGEVPQITLTASASSAPADSSSKITFTVSTFEYKCGGTYQSSSTCPGGSAAEVVPRSGQNIGIYTTSTGNIFGQTGTGEDGAPSATTGGDGKAQFTIASSTVASKSFKAYIYGWFPISSTYWPTATVNFTAPVAVAPTPAAPKPTPKPATPAPAEVAPPANPQIATLETDGESVATDKEFTLDYNKPLTLKGSTVPNGVVKLYVFSTPREATVTADAQGAWTYTVEGLESGAHHIEAEVTDPATQKTSARAKLATFSVSEPKPVTTAQTVEKSSKTPWIVAGVVLVLAALCAGWWFWKRKKSGNYKASTPNLPTDKEGPSSTDIPIL